MKAIVKKYGNGGSLIDVPAESYPALVSEVEDLKDAYSASFLQAKSPAPPPFSDFRQRSSRRKFL